MDFVSKICIATSLLTGSTNHKLLNHVFGNVLLFDKDTIKKLKARCVQRVFDMSNLTVIDNFFKDNIITCAEHKK